MHSEITRLSEAGLLPDEKINTTCCSAVQDKGWVSGPAGERWEVYTVIADSDTFGPSNDQPDETCCTAMTRRDPELAISPSVPGACADACCSPPAQGPIEPQRRAVLARRVRLLVSATITYNLIEAVVAIAAGRPRRLA